MKFCGPATFDEIQNPWWCLCRRSGCGVACDPPPLVTKLVLWGGGIIWNAVPETCLTKSHHPMVTGVRGCLQGSFWALDHLRRGCVAISKLLFVSLHHWAEGRGTWLRYVAVILCFLVVSPWPCYVKRSSQANVMGLYWAPKGCPDS